MALPEHLRRQADLATAAVVYAVTLITTGTVDATTLIIGAVACGALAGRRHFPFAVLAVSALAAEAYLVHLQGTHGTMVLAAPLIALYTVAETSPRRRALIIGVLVVLAFGGLHILGKPASWLGAENIALAALGGLAVAAGDASRSRRAYLAEVEARAHHAERDREAEAARRVTEERLRIARDLHDAVGHQLALIYVQAGVAEQVPEKAQDALKHIRAASKTALGELSDTVGLLRRPEDPSPPVDPVAGLAGLDGLLATFRRSGLTIATQVDGALRSIPVTADLTAYRVIQEALTNVRKHAGPTTVDVRLIYEPGRLRMTVDNQAPTIAPPPRGTTAAHGLVGMRERVTALGGDLSAGPRPDGGFRVSATIPVAA